MKTNMLGGIIKGRYKLIDEIESGSFGTVYIARDKENNSLYAAKIMHSEHANDQELISRFQREAYILQGLSDPHIVRIIDCGNDGALYYIVMEEFMGTAYYVAPEQVDSAHLADTRSDLYSLGIILFEMLNGHPPYQGG